MRAALPVIRARARRTTIVRAQLGLCDGIIFLSRPPHYEHAVPSANAAACLCSYFSTMAPDAPQITNQVPTWFLERFCRPLQRKGTRRPVASARAGRHADPIRRELNARTNEGAFSLRRGKMAAK
jgi:hypothetical protein